MIDVLLFGALRECAGADHVVVPITATTTCAALLAAVAATHPDVAPHLPTVRVAINQRYAAAGDTVPPDAEVALIPPVAGGTPRLSVQLIDTAIDIAAVHAAIADPRAGGHTVFVGRVRNHHDGQAVAHLSYQAYEPMAQRMLHDLLRTVAATHDLTAACVVHRLGRIDIGEAAIALGVSAPHRSATFAAVAAAMDAIKRDVPIFKREVYADGSHAWVRCEHVHPHSEGQHA